MTLFGRRAAIGAIAAAIPLLTSTAWGQECSVSTPSLQESLSPDDALAILKRGNARFTARESINCDLIQQVHATAAHQSPIAAVLGCIDSRVPPELVFDQRIGDIFAARVAGNFANVDILGSLEYATEVAGAKAIVVLGHSSCGAIKSAVDNVQLGNITAMLANIQPAVDAVRAQSGPFTSKDTALVQAVAETNARMTGADLIERSVILRRRVDSGLLKIVAAMHNVHTGHITWL